MSLISHSSKILLWVILSRLKAKAEELPAEEQASFRPGRSTVEQTFNSRVIIEKHLQHQRDMFHNFLDFKNAIDRVLHAGLWQVLRGFNIEEGLIQAIQALYENSSSAILFNSQLGEFFETTVGVRQGCLLASIVFNLFQKNIMQKTLHDRYTSISIDGGSICNLQFADDIDLMGGNNGELQDLSNRFVDRATAYGVTISIQKCKIVTNSTKNINAYIIMNGQKLEEVTSFKYLGTTLSKGGTCSAEVRIRIASATAANARLNRIWRSNTISFESKF